MNEEKDRKAAVTSAIESWLRECVVGLSLCPYARAPFDSGRIKIVVCSADELSTVLEGEIELLQANSINPETTLITLADGLQDFLDFNDCVGEIEDLLHATGLDSTVQLASFHPAFLFGGEAPDDASHYSNRAPYPVVQLLRTTSVSKAVDTGDTLLIPERNMATLRALEPSQLGKLFPWVE